MRDYGAERIATCHVMRLRCGTEWGVMHLSASAAILLPRFCLHGMKGMWYHCADLQNIIERLKH